MPYQVRVFLIQQLIELRKNGFNVTVISGKDPILEKQLSLNGIKYEVIQFVRGPSFFADLKSLLKLIRILKKINPDIVHSMSSKAGLLSSVAGKIAGINITIHTFAGNPWLGKRGIVRWVAILSDKLICYFNSACLSDSFSQVKLLESSNICIPSSIKVIANGSVCGVDLNRFKVTVPSKALKNNLGINAKSVVIIFIGRITREKGIEDLAHVVRNLNDAKKSFHLLLLGDEDVYHDPPQIEYLKFLKTQPNVHFIGFVADPEKYLSISNILLIPSYREGFCNAVIEAGAMGVPAIGYRISGLIDSIQDGETGILVEERNIKEMSRKVIQMVEHPERVRQLGQNARTRVVEKFSADFVNLNTRLFYYEMLRCRRWDHLSI